MTFHAIVPKDELSRGFTHFFKLISDRDNITFKSLRKTYISHLAMALGERTALLTGHTNNEVLRNHYLSGAFVAGNLGEFKVF